MRRTRATCAAALLTVLGGPSAAAAATTFGAPALTASPQPGAACPAGAAACTTVLSAFGTRAPSAGIVVAFSVRLQPGDRTLTLRIARQDGGGWRAVTTDATPRTAHGGTVERFPARVPVQTGDALALLSDRVPDGLDPAGGPLAVLAGAWADGAVRPSADATLSSGLALQAELEPDADADGYGDLTQDGCPDEGARHEPPCALALTADVAAGPAFAVAGDRVTHVFRIAASGTRTAPGVSVRVAGAGELTSEAGSCTPGPTPSCALGDLAAGTSATVTATTTTTAPGDLELTATAATTGATPRDVQTTVTAATVVTPPSVAPPPVVFARPACVNLQRGTNDDEVLDGTDFGDRLQGRGGRDLLHGDGAADCLEGGTGADVLDGGDGDDRLNGASGNDRLLGGPGRDRLTGGPGRDRIAGGAGNDTILARDGARDLVECGPGSDSVTADRADRVRGCERVSRR